jgi:hypothetical protein
MFFIAAPYMAPATEPGSSGPSLMGSLLLDSERTRAICPGVHIELEYAGDHDDGLGLIAVLEKRELQCFRAVDKQAAAKVLLVLHHPMTVTVPADVEELGARGRFNLVHDTTPLG